MDALASVFITDVTTFWAATAGKSIKELTKGAHIALLDWFTGKCGISFHVLLVAGRTLALPELIHYLRAVARGAAFVTSLFSFLSWLVLFSSRLLVFLLFSRLVRLSRLNLLGRLLTTWGWFFSSSVALYVLHESGAMCRLNTYQE